MKIKLILLSLSLACSVHANIITLGEIDLTGTFTYSPQEAVINGTLVETQFGTLSPLTVQNATGIFAPYVSVGDALGMQTNILNYQYPPPTWTIDGFTITTSPSSFFQIGTDTVHADFTLSGNGFDPSAYNPPFGATSGWSFDFLPFEFQPTPPGTTAPIQMQIGVAYERVPDSGATFFLFAFALLSLAAYYAMNRDAPQHTRVAGHGIGKI